MYGDAPNDLPLVEQEQRYELDPSHPYAEHGIPEELRIDRSLHSLFGASKAAADLLVQECGRYFGLRSAAFRGGCLTGPGHSGAELHGFLAYLARCALEGTPYTVYGYKSKQVRDNIHAHDLATAFWHFFQEPHTAEVYNIGAGRHSNCSMLEAVAAVEHETGAQSNGPTKRSTASATTSGGSPTCAASRPTPRAGPPATTRPPSTTERRSAFAGVVSSCIRGVMARRV